jgi:hypothetical protein
MTKIRRGGYVFVTWVGDHAPRHLHVFDDRRLVVKWDLEHRVEMEGVASRRIRRIIDELVDEGLLG